MAFIEKITRNGKTYYYATKGFRTSTGSWKKIRRYLGKTKPDDKTLREAFHEIEKDVMQIGLGTKNKYKFLGPEECEVIEDIKTAYKHWAEKLGRAGRENYLTDFLVRFTYNSNAIEGNRLSIRETAITLADGAFPPGADHKDIVETLNSKDAFKLLQRYRKGLNKTLVLKVHGELTKDTGCRIVGKYRDCDVRIFGSDWVPPPAKMVPSLMNDLFIWYNNNKARYHPIELGALAHLRLAQIHPFVDGNGRTARMIMNWVLHKNGYPMIYIEVNNKKDYYKALESADDGNEKTFVDYIVGRLREQITFVVQKKGIRPQKN